MDLKIPKQIPQLFGEVSPKVEREITLSFNRLYNQIDLLINHIEDLKTNQSVQIQSFKKETQALIGNLAIPLIGETNPTNPLVGVGTNPGSGTVLSFSVAQPAIFNVTNAATTPQLEFKIQNKNKGLFGPTTGADAIPSFRLLISSDLPRTSSASDPSITELPNNGDYCCHLNTVSGFVYLAYNKSGSVLKIQLV